MTIYSGIPQEKHVIFHSYVSHYQRVIPNFDVCRSWPRICPTPCRSALDTSPRPLSAAVFDHLLGRFSKKSLPEKSAGNWRTPKSLFLFSSGWWFQVSIRVFRKNARFTLPNILDNELCKLQYSTAFPQWNLGQKYQKIMWTLIWKHHRWPVSWSTSRPWRRGEGGEDRTGNRGCF